MFHGRGGVAIFLNKRAQQAWVAAGSHQPTAYKIDDDIAQIIGIKLKFMKGGKHCNIHLTSIYCPHAGQGTKYIETFFDHLNDYIEAIPKNYKVIIGGDLNTPLGTNKNKSSKSSIYHL